MYSSLLPFRYCPTTNDLVFDTHVPRSADSHHCHYAPPSSDVVIDGEDTGGQMVRCCLQLAILIAGGRGGAPIPTLTIASKEKACLLYVSQDTAFVSPTPRYCFGSC